MYVSIMKLKLLQAKNLYSGPFYCSINSSMLLRFFAIFSLFGKPGDVREPKDCRLLEPKITWVGAIRIFGRIVRKSELKKLFIGDLDHSLFCKFQNKVLFDANHPYCFLALFLNQFHKPVEYFVLVHLADLWNKSLYDLLWQLWRNISAYSCNFQFSVATPLKKNNKPMDNNWS